jgi:hypothetical protein
MFRRKDNHSSFMLIQYIPCQMLKRVFQEQITPIDHNPVRCCLNFLGFDLMAGYPSWRRAFFMLNKLYLASNSIPLKVFEELLVDFVATVAAAEDDYCTSIVTL